MPKFASSKCLKLDTDIIVLGLELLRIYSFGQCQCKLQAFSNFRSAQDSHRILLILSSAATGIKRHFKLMKTLGGELLPRFCLGIISLWFVTGSGRCKKNVSKKAEKLRVA